MIISKDVINFLLIEHFEKSYLSGQSNHNQFTINLFYPIISTTQNRNINVILGEEEIWTTLFNFKSPKAPCLMVFSLSSLRVIGILSSLVRLVLLLHYHSMVQGFFTKNYFTTIHNKTHPCLVTKPPPELTSSDLLPFATHYKIISEILASRIKPMLEKIMTFNQSDFV